MRWGGGSGDADSVSAPFVSGGCATGRAIALWALGSAMWLLMTPLSCAGRVGGCWKAEHDRQRDSAV